MENGGTKFRVGLLIVVGAVAVFGLVFFLSGQRWRRGQNFETYFTESVQGLEVGAPVKFRGVTLGRVSAIGLVSAEYGRDATLEMSAENYRLVFVRFTIDPARVGRMPDAESAARTGLRARVAAVGITGLSYIELDFVDPIQFPARAVSWAPKAEYIPSMPSTLIQVQDAAQRLLATLNKVDLEGLVFSATSLIQEIRENLRSGDVHVGLQRLQALLDTLQDHVKRADIPGLTADLRDTSGAIRAVAEGKELHALLANVGTAADRFGLVATRLQPLIAALEATARRAGEGTADVHQALVPLLRDAQAAAANLRETTETLRQYPAGALLGGPPPRSPERVR